MGRHNKHQAHIMPTQITRIISAFNYPQSTHILLHHVEWPTLYPGISFPNGQKVIPYLQYWLSHMTRFEFLVAKSAAPIWGNTHGTYMLGSFHKHENPRWKCLSDLDIIPERHALYKHQKWFMLKIKISFKGPKGEQISECAIFTATNEVKATQMRQN